jgi:hypothetical protein
MADDLDLLVDELYALPLERFVPERDLLAKQLRADGRREDARRVAGLTKPSVVAWAVNQVVRAQRAGAERLWEAGDAVLETQGRVVAGEASGQDLRSAIEAEREALAPLADAARGLVTASGKFLGEQNVQAVIESLHAAAIDPGARPQVAAGRLVRPLRLTGLEAAVAGGAARRAGREAAAGEAAGSADAAEARERIARREASDARSEVERRRAAREERARRQAAQRALVRAEREREKARERITAAVRRRDEAAGAVERARRELEAAETALAAAEEDLAAAHDDLEQAEDAVDRAREDVASR